MESFLIKMLEHIDSHPLLNPKTSKNLYVPIDLSVQNERLNNINISSSKDLETFIWDHLKKNRAKVAFGGYLEKRGIYQRSNYFNRSNKETDRDIHLGIDLWTEAGSAIYAPLDGTIHSFQNNTNFGDYGPTIILKHLINNTQFYTLYGHLDLLSLSDKIIGNSIQKGTPFAALGTSEVNGDYAPHLHFQIIKELQDNTGDYPGVCNKTELDFYKRNCPDPNLLLRLEA